MTETAEQLYETMLEDTKRILDVARIYRNQDYLPEKVHDVISAKSFHLDWMQKSPNYIGGGRIAFVVEEEIPAITEVVESELKNMELVVDAVLPREWSHGPFTYSELVEYKKRLRNKITKASEIEADSVRGVPIDVLVSDYYRYEGYLNNVMWSDDFMIRNGLYVDRKSGKDANAFVEVLKYIASHQRNTLTDNDSQIINLYMYDASARMPTFRSGQKPVTVINKIANMIGLMDKLNWPRFSNQKTIWNKAIAKVGDYIYSRSHNRLFVISCNYADMLTASNGRGWTSCCNWNPEGHEDGMWPAGFNRRVMDAYANDEVTLVCYTLPVDCDDIVLTPRYNRQMFHFNGDEFIQSRMYPQGEGGETQYKAWRRRVMHEYRAATESDDKFSAFNHGLIEYSDMSWLSIPDNYGFSTVDFLTDASHGDGADSRERFENLVGWCRKLPADEGNYKPMKILGDTKCLRCGCSHHNNENFYCTRCE